MGHGGQPVRHHQHSLVFHDFTELVLDKRLGDRVQVRGGFIHHQNRSALQQHSGDRNALALTTGQLDATLAHQADFLAGEGDDIQVLENRLVAAVTETYVAELDIAAQELQCLGTGLVDDFMGGDSRCVRSWPDQLWCDAQAGSFAAHPLPRTLGPLSTSLAVSAFDSP